MKHSTYKDSILRQMWDILQMWLMLKWIGRIEDYTCRGNMGLTMDNHVRDIRMDHLILQYARHNGRNHYFGRAWCWITHKKHVEKVCLGCEFDSFDEDEATPGERKQASKAARLIRLALAWEPKPLLDVRKKKDEQGIEFDHLKLSTAGETFLDPTNLISCLYKRYWATTASLFLLATGTLGSLIYKALDVLGIYLKSL